MLCLIILLSTLPFWPGKAITLEHCNKSLSQCYSLEILFLGEVITPNYLFHYLDPNSVTTIIICAIFNTRLITLD